MSLILNVLHIGDILYDKRQHNHYRACDHSDMVANERQLPQNTAKRLQSIFFLLCLLVELY